MSLSTWLLYATAVIVLTVTPGPTVLMCMANAVQHGPRHAMISVMGSTVAIVTIMALSALGMGAVLATSETAFLVLKWCGAAYLAYLGISMILSRQPAIETAHDRDQTPMPTVRPGPIRRRKLALQGLLVGASNPKALLFFSALFPQFIDPTAPQWPQFLILSSTFVVFEVFWLSVYALAARRAQAWLRTPRHNQWFNRVTGAVFLLAAGAVALTRRTPA